MCFWVSAVTHATKHADWFVCHGFSFQLSTWITYSLSIAWQKRGDPEEYGLTHRGRVTYICVHKLNVNHSDNGLSRIQHQAIIWTNAGISLIHTLGKHFSEILSEIHTFWRQFCLGLNGFIDKYEKTTKRKPYAFFGMSCIYSWSIFFVVDMLHIIVTS